MENMVTAHKLAGSPENEGKVRLNMPKSAIPAFDPNDSTPISAFLVEPPIPALPKSIYLGAPGSELNLSDQETIGDLDTDSGDLLIDEALLGTLGVSGLKFPFVTFASGGHEYTQIILAEPAAPPAP